MKLISCYIENFGGLSGYSLSFSEGLTAVQEHNGFGKTTLAEFLRAMFYGLPRNSADAGKSLRKKYCPWQGGTFGGNLVFSADNQTYRLERTFGDSHKKDTFRLIDLATGLDSPRYTENIGLELFGLDSESFERSTYLPQSTGVRELTTNNIQAKLSNLLEDRGDIGSFDKAMQSLRSRRSALKPFSGKGGAIYEAQGQISQLQGQIAELSQLQQQLEPLREQLAALETAAAQDTAAAQQLQAQIRQAAEQSAARQVHRTAAELEAQLHQLQAQTAELSARYPEGIPDAEALERAQQLQQQRKLLQSQQAAAAQAEADADGAHTCSRFADGVPTPEQIEAHRSSLADAALLRREAELMEQQPTPAVWGKAIGLAVLAVAAGVLGWLVHPVLAAVLPAAVAALGVALYLRRRRDLSARRLEIAEKYRQSQALSLQVAEYLKRFGCADGDLSRQLTALQQDAADYLRRQEQLAQRESRRKQLDAEAEDCSRELAAFARHYGLTGRTLGEVAADRSRMAGLTEAAARAQSRLETYRQENAAVLQQPLPEQPLDLDALQQQERSLVQQQQAHTRSLMQLQHTQQQLLARMEQLPAAQDALEAWKQKKAEATEQLAVVDTTIQMLQTARDRLSCHYMGTVGQRFAWYMQQLMEEEEAHIRLDSRLAVQLERQGIARDLRYFSAGQEDLILLCMRFALVDALFTEEQPFVILDDPFVNLDDAHLQRAIHLLHRLSQSRQIIYCTCHSSRLP